MSKQKRPRKPGICLRKEVAYLLLLNDALDLLRALADMQYLGMPDLREHSRSCEETYQSLRRKYYAVREEIEYEQKQKEKARKARERSQAKKRLADYWQEHAEEKASLEAEQTELKTKAAELDQALADLENDPDAVAHGREYDRLSDREEELMKQRVRLNIFQGGKTPLSLCSRSTDKGFRNLLNVLSAFEGYSAYAPEQLL